MTRAQEPDSEIDYASVGTPGAARTIVVLRTGDVATTDPVPGATAGYDVRLVLVHLEVPELDDPAAYGGQTPAAATAAALASLVQREQPAGTLGLLGERATTAITVGLAAELGERVDRLAIVAPLVPDEPLDRDLAASVLAEVQGAALLVSAASEPATIEAARWTAEHLAHAEAVELSEADVDSVDGRVGLSDAWSRVLVHLAPGATL